MLRNTRDAMCSSNFYKYTLTLKAGLGVTQGHRKWHQWIIIYDFLLTFYSNYGSI